LGFRLFMGFFAGIFWLQIATFLGVA
jgi:hypothetical protein